jgi:hypothetical protein
VISDNTERYRGEYADYFAFLAANGFRTMTLPFDGGLELSVRCQPRKDNYCGCTSKSAPT